MVQNNYNDGLGRRLEINSRVEKAPILFRKVNHMSTTGIEDVMWIDGGATIIHSSSEDVWGQSPYQQNWSLGYPELPEASIGYYGGDRSSSSQPWLIYPRNFNAVIDKSSSNHHDAGGLFIGTQDDNGDENAFMCFNQYDDEGY